MFCPAGCFAVLWFYQAELCIKEQVEEDGGREVDEREQPEIGGDC